MMVKLFRNIRKKLLIEEKTSKYLKYAIGEILLVVIGILIALQINNWNENRMKQQILKTHLTNSIQDLKADHKTIKKLEKLHNLRYYSMQYLSKTSGAGNYNPKDDHSKIPLFKSDLWKKDIPTTYNKQFIQKAFVWSHRIPHYKSNEDTRKELQSTGYYSYLRNDLKSTLNNYDLEWNLYFKEIKAKLAEDWLVSLGEDGFTNADTYTLEDPLSLLKDQPKRIGILKRMIREAGWVLIGVKKNRELNNKLIKNIEMEISTL
ncbi:MAG TPA: DUF6090 family protein [Yeosuana sp.]